MRSPLVWFLIAASIITFVSQLGEPPSVPECALTATPIHAIQGEQLRSPHVGESVTVSAVVIADFRGPGELGGFFVQDEDTDADGDPGTSEGLFVEYADAALPLEVGQLVCVTGTVAERDGSTLLRRVTEIIPHGIAEQPTPAQLALPLQTSEELECYEGMLVSLPAALTVTGTYGLARYGELLVAPERLSIPTSIAQPGAPACAVADQNQRLRLRLDDGRSIENPDPIPYPMGGLSPETPIRSGDMLAGLKGILDERWGDYRLHPIQELTLRASGRPADPPAVNGRLRVVGFNIANYFNGDGDGDGFPTTRGAATPEEFARQHAKLVSALSAMKPDIAGLVEVENDGYGPASAIANLVRGLNEVEEDDSAFAFIVPATDRLGTDDIAVALIYRTGAVRPVGSARFPESFSPLTRVPLAQEFEEVATGERFTVVVNHFKARSPSRATGGNRDQGDEQGCWNQRRTEASDALLAWLTEAGIEGSDSNVLMVGDYNAYVNEDPIQRFADAGYTEMLAALIGPSAYTYVYDGESGAIDLALASSTLRSQIVDAAIWHINADEVTAFDYRTRYKSEQQIESLYAADPFRSSDHDPVIVGLDLGVVAR